MATFETVGKVFKLLSRAYTDYASKHLRGGEAVETMRLYQRILQDIPDPVLETACVDHMASSQWWPKPSELRERCVSLMINERGGLAPSEAWGVVTRRLRVPERTIVNGVEYVRRPCDETTERAVEAIGGWMYLRHSEDAVADRARFLQAYSDIAARERRKIAEHPAVTETRLSIAERTHLQEISVDDTWVTT